MKLQFLSNRTVVAIVYVGITQKVMCAINIVAFKNPREISCDKNHLCRMLLVHLT